MVQDLTMSLEIAWQYFQDLTKMAITPSCLKTDISLKPWYIRQWMICIFKECWASCFACSWTSCLSLFSCNTRRCSIEFDRISISFPACFGVWTGRVHRVCIRLKLMRSIYWKVWTHRNILSLVCIQVIKELLFWVAHIQTKCTCVKFRREHSSN